MSKTFSTKSFSNKSFSSKSFLTKSFKPYISSYIQTWYNSLSTKPSSSLLTDLNNLYDGIYFDGDGQEIDLFHPIAGLETDEQRLRPIISTSGNDFTNVNSAVLSTGGMQGNGVDSYLDLKWLPTDNGVKFTQDSACMGCYSRTNSLSANNDMGCAKTSDATFLQIYSKYTDNNFYYRINMNTGLPGTIVTDSLSLHAISRNSATTVESWYRGVSQGTENFNSTGKTPFSIYLGGANINGVFIQPSVRQLSFPFVGSKLVNQLRIYNRIQAYMTSRGIQV